MAIDPSMIWSSDMRERFSSSRNMPTAKKNLFTSGPVGVSHRVMYGSVPAVLASRNSCLCTYEVITGVSLRIMIPKQSCMSSFLFKTGQDEKNPRPWYMSTGLSTSGAPSSPNGAPKWRRHNALNSPFTEID